MRPHGFLGWTCAMMMWTVSLMPVRAQQPDKSEAPMPAADTIAVISVEGSVTESPLTEDLPFAVDVSISLRELVGRIRKAADDPRVAAVVLRADSVGLGPAQIEEVRRALQSLRDAGKPVYAHVDSLSMQQFVLLSGATRLSVTPTGDVWVTGMYAESPYLRELLDKVGIVPDFLTCGAYKSAAEMFMRSSPSDEAKENLEWLIDGIFATYVRLIAEGRKVTAEQAEKWINHGLYSANAAKEAGLIDAVEHHQQFVAHLKEVHGPRIKFDKKYGRKKGVEIDLSSPFGLLKFYSELLAGSSPKSTGKDAIAVIYVEGPIMPGSGGTDPLDALLASQGAYSTPIRQALDKAAADESIKAVVLRINSPGGSATASEIILEASKRVAAVKPFVVSMGDVAGSGGYYVACGADTIFADESTITGSIGVVGGKLSTVGLWRKIGIHWDATQRGAHAGMLQGPNPFTPDERERLQAWMDEIYTVFKGHVTDIRGSRLKKDIEDLAGGRVFTGRQALELGLVDHIGGLDDALRFAADKAGLAPGQYEVRTLPKAPGFLDALMGTSPSDSDPHSLRSSPAGLRELGPLWQAAAPLLAGADPVRSRALRSALRNLELLQRERVTLTMPVWAIGAAPTR